MEKGATQEAPKMNNASVIILLLLLFEEQTSWNRMPI